MSTATEITSDVDVDTDRPWVVIVWNDPINLMSYVTWVFQKLFGYSLEKATELMLDVHERVLVLCRAVLRGKRHSQSCRLCQGVEYLRSDFIERFCYS